jgi:Outer membrane protein beta-barrel domain
MKKETTLAFLFFFSILTFVKAQQYNSPFKAGLTFGINKTQIDGDDQFGYNRRGYNFGLRGAVILSKNMDISTELLYSERGTQPDDTEKLKNKRTTNVALKYAEVPFLFNFYYNKAEDGHYRWNVYTGLSYGRLLRSQVSVFKGSSITDTIQQNLVNTIGMNTSDLSYVIGIKRYFTNRVGLSVRHTNSLNLVYKNDAAITAPRNTAISKNYNSFRSFFYSVNVFYDFVTPKLQVKKVRKKK